MVLFVSFVLKQHKYSFQHGNRLPSTVKYKQNGTKNNDLKGRKRPL